MQEDAKIIVCPYSEKMKILSRFAEEDVLHPICFFTKEEFFQKYFFSYDAKTLFYLMKEYGFHLDVAKVYLKYLPVIGSRFSYHHEKLLFLQRLKNDLLDKGLLYFSSGFSQYLSSQKIEVFNYYKLDLFEEKALSYSFSIPDVSFKNSVYEFMTMEEEVNFVCIQILHLLQKGIPITKISLCNVSDDYYYTLQKMFSYYHIPINIPFKYSIYGTKIVSDYLSLGSFGDVSQDGGEVVDLLNTVLSELSELDREDPIYHELLSDRFQHTYVSNSKFFHAVSVKNLYQDSFDSDEYVFVLGFNLDSLPILEKDISYLTDDVLEEVDLYPTTYKNQREKKLIPYLLSQISHLFLSYKLSTPFQTFYPSSLISDYQLSVVHPDVDTFQFSHFYNKLRLGSMLDQFYLYGEKHPFLERLNTYYSIPYLSYQNQFTGISEEKFLNHLSMPLSLSYTSLNSYHECRFKYYIQYVLKLDEYQDSFPSFIGSMYHKILSLYSMDSFDFEEEFSKYLEKRELTFKEKLLLVRIKKELMNFIQVLKKQDLLTGFDSRLFEEKIEVELSSKPAIQFVGYLDKILYYQKLEDTYFAIVDYKTGSIDTHIEPMKYGLHMQLPIYLYLIRHGRLFSHPIFTGIYYQNILFSYPSWSSKILQQKKDATLLKGYSTDDIDVLSRFDSTVCDSELIKSMKYSEDKGFGSFSKTLSSRTVDQLIQYTSDSIHKSAEDILHADFSIHPKIYDHENVSCRFCSFRDLCFVCEKDFTYYDKVEDLSFLGGEE